VKARLPEPDALLVDKLMVRRDERVVVRDASLRIPAGQVVALLGPNGAGKSSLVLAMSGLLRPDSGSVRLSYGAGQYSDLTGLRPERIRRLGLATAPEGHRVLGELRVIDNLRVAGARLGRTAYTENLERVLTLFPELRPLTRRWAGTLSGGEQQMLVLAQTLIDRPRFLVIDELSLGLAPAVVRRLAPALTEIAAMGIGVLLIEQFTELALSLSTSVSVLIRGEIRLTENAATLRVEPSRLHAAYHLTTAMQTTNHG
jgi:branched-chain amino acid transport system ATP-binding protein